MEKVLFDLNVGPKELHAASKDCVAETLPDKPTSFQVKSKGKLVRQALDTNQDMILDQWVYFRDGKEVYRDIDSDFDRKIDTCRYLKTYLQDTIVVTGKDTNQDGSFDEFSQSEKVIVALHPGRLRLKVNVGDTVVQGQVLAIIDNKEPANELKEAVSRRYKLQTFIETAKEQLDKLNDDSDKNEEIRSMLSTATAQFQESLATENKKIADLEKQIEQIFISPKPGMIVQAAKSGEPVKKGDLILTILTP